MNGKQLALLVASGMGLMIPRLPAEDIVLEGPSQRATLVELYSSEGCSSCPPAEKWISQLKADPRLWQQIVPVVFHVDYWDGLGWPDRFAQKFYTQRQSDYQARWNAASVYTPEFIVDAREWHAWFDGGELPLAKADAVGPLKLVVHRDTWGVEVTQAPVDSTMPVQVMVNVAWLGMNIASDVRGGENDGRKLLHDFVVLDFQSKPASNDAKDKILAQFSGPTPRPAADRPEAVAVWTNRDNGSILQVAGGWLK